ncbi:NACHT and WD40 domain protein [Penicillium waksmanii]|uniref:NACHT and WD40 domain protein n=1 Tax=Penicillium waksmanii TaxID=69791 RepID=UPI002547BB52|nr:NACHT and WD40 domain protein [Penicillium waksmanii]KAJ5984631.1 NACHT and WD40 domain protein [Penicillium waksmanii]
MDGLSSAANVFGAIALTGSIVKICGSYITEAKNARDDIFTLQRSAAGLENILLSLAKILQGRGAMELSVSSNISDDIDNCISDLEALETKINPRQKKGVMRRFGLRSLKWPIQRPEIDRLVENLERYKSLFILSMQVDQTVLLTEVAQSLETSKDTINLDKLSVARGAEFDSFLDQHEQVCLPGTRTEIIDNVIAWATSPEERCMFWLNGKAGTGKSTISRTLAKFLKEKKVLGASFFFKRGEADRGNAMKLFSTITRQLLIHIPQLAPGIQKSLEADPEVACKSLTEQFDKLILQPLKSVKQAQLSLSKACTYHNMVIIIDALDECARDEDIRAILRLLPALQESEIIRLGVFITSRPELPTRLGFSQMQKLGYRSVVLDEVPWSVIQHDISLFLRHRLSEIGSDRNLPCNWPMESDIQSLVKMSTPPVYFCCYRLPCLGGPPMGPRRELEEAAHIPE